MGCRDDPRTNRRSPQADRPSPPQRAAVHHRRSACPLDRPVGPARSLHPTGGHRCTASDPGILHGFPLAPCREGWHPLGWVGSLLVMLVTACTAIPLGVAAGVYLEEYAPKNWFTAIIEINVMNLAGVPFDHLRPPGAGAVRLSVWLRPEHPLRRADVGVADPADRHRCHSRGAARCPGIIREAAYALGATRWQMVSQHVVPYSAGGIMTGVIIGLSAPSARPRRSSPSVP